MKAKFFFLGLCALALAACSIDEVSQVNDTNAIQFKATTATRVAATTTNSLTEFSVWAWNGGNEFMDGVTAERNGSSSTFTTSPLYFWPTGTVDFYAVSPVAEVFGIEDNTEYAYFGGTLNEGDDVDPSWTYTGNVAKATIANDNIVFDVVIPSKAEDQIDLCYAITKGQSSGAVPMNFRHALSQVTFKAKNVNEGFVVDIAGISVCSAYKTGTYTLKGVSSTTTHLDEGDSTSPASSSQGEWDYDNEGHKARFAAGIAATTLDYEEGEVVNITSDPLMLLPQTVEGWDPLTDEHDASLGSYIAVLCHVTEHGSTLWPNENETGYTESIGGTEYAYIAMPVDIAWEEGYRYTYTIIFGEGLGYYPPDDPNWELDGTPVLNIITFDVTVDEFQDAEGVEVDTTTETEEEEPFEPTGAGTAEEPYSIADALGLIEEGETSDEMVYVSGIVSEISEVSPLSVTSGHATYFISDDGTTENQIEVFDGLYLGGLAFDDADEIKVGDEIVVYGYLEMVDETPEITNSIIYSLNGETYQEPELELEGDGTVDNPYTVTDLFTLIEAGETIEEKVYVTGLVGSITGFDSEKGTENYYISVDGTNSDESVYVLEGLFLGGKPFEYMNDILIDDEVVVYGYLGTDTEGKPQITESEIYSLNGSTYEDQPQPTYIDGHEYVDLGLSVLWATCNIGAETRKDYGNYYAWGEIETKDTYSYSTSVTYNKEDMEDFSGNAEYDAATANWGSKWRMPTSAEYEELIENCTILALTGENNSRVAWKFTSTVNGNSIVFSKPGYYYTDYITGAGTSCLYWTSTPVADSSRNSYRFAVYYETSLRSAEEAPRYYGLPIRPVADKED